MQSNDMPDIEIEYDDGFNPIIKSPNADFGISFYQTQMTLMDVDVYKRFLNNAISRFRHSETYKNYKSYLMGMGLDKCFMLSNITAESVGAKGIEMHHNFITIFDIALMITEHVINTVGHISTFDLVQLLKEEHKANHVPIVMLSKTVHQMYHNSEDACIPAHMCFGYWIELFKRYPMGVTKTIAAKLLNYIDQSVNNMAVETKTMVGMLELRNELVDYSEYNQYGNNRRISTITTTQWYEDPEEEAIW